MARVLPRRKYARLSIHKQEAIFGYLFILPALAILAIFVIYPVISGFVISFLEWDVLSASHFVGLDNYRKLLVDTDFKTALWNTAYYAGVTVPLTILISLGLALLLNQGLIGTATYRAIYFLPVITSSVAISVVWKWIYNPDYGLLNIALYSLGLPCPDWLGSTTWAMPAIIIMSIWRGLGSNIVIFLAGLQGVPRSLYEAATIDGASRYQLFRHITLPLISPTTFFVLVMSVISSFQVFDQVMVMTQGGPGNATLVVVYHIYREAFRNFRMGYASAAAYVLFLLILILTLFQWVGRRRWVYTEVE